MIPCVRRIAFDSVRAPPPLRQESARELGAPHARQKQIAAGYFAKVKSILRSAGPEVRRRRAFLAFSFGPMIIWVFFMRMAQPEDERTMANTAIPSMSGAELNGLFEYNPGTPLEIEVVGGEPVEGVQIEDISFVSPKGGRVPSFLIAPSGNGSLAGVIMMHGGQGDRTQFLSEAIDLAKSGAASILIDAPHNRPGQSPSSALMLNPEKERAMYIQLVIDLRRAIDLLLTRPGIDSKRIGYIGHSLGATWGGVLAGVDKRIKAFVLMGGLPVLYDFSENAGIARVLKSILTPQQMERYVEVLAPIAPENFVSRAAPADMFFQFARHDRFITLRSAERYASASSEPKLARWYFTSHEFNDARSRADRFTWLGKELSLSPVAAIPTPDSNQASRPPSAPTLFEKLFSSGIMTMGPARDDPQQQVGVFTQDLVASFPALRLSELEKLRWLAGEWSVTNRVPASRANPAYTDHTSLTYKFCEKDAWICMVGADGKERPHITFDPFTRQWMFVLADGAYGILHSSGWSGNQIVFTGPMSMIGVDCQLRQTWTKKGDDEFHVLNEEMMDEGRWGYVDEFEFRRK